MYEWIPKKTNNTADKMILLLFGGSAALVLLTTLAPAIPYRWVFQLLAMGLLAAAIFLVTRYRTKSFLYRVGDDGDGGVDLSVTETAPNGKRAVTVCRVGLGNILKLYELDLSDGGASAATWRELTRRRGKIFDYAIDLRPTRFLVVVAREGGEEVRIRLSYLPELCELLARSAKDEEEDV
jgi:hypothetical protein